MVSYIGEFKNPWIKAWFDVGNVVLYGYAQDWIRTLGKNISNVHLKDFKRKESGYAWVNLGDGDVDWPAVRQAFADIGYSGSAIAELETGDETYLRDVSRRIDRLLLGRGYSITRAISPRANPNSGSTLPLPARDNLSRLAAKLQSSATSIPLS
jgi:hypothetical protein